MRKHGKLDQNQHVIVDALRRFGYVVQSLASCGQGVPDLLVAKLGRIYLIEVKTPKGKITPQQEDFRQQWPVVIVRSVQDVAAFDAMRHPMPRHAAATMAPAVAPLPPGASATHETGPPVPGPVRAGKTRRRARPSHSPDRSAHVR